MFRRPTVAEVVFIVILPRTFYIDSMPICFNLKYVCLALAILWFDMHVDLYFHVPFGLFRITC